MLKHKQYQHWQREFGWKEKEKKQDFRILHLCLCYPLRIYKIILTEYTHFKNVIQTEK